MLFQSVCLSVCLSVCHHQFVWLGLFLRTLIRYMGFMGTLFSCLVGCFSMIILTPALLSVLNGCVLYFCICTCSAQLSMFHMERRSKNTLIIIIIVVVVAVAVAQILILKSVSLTITENKLHKHSFYISDSARFIYF